MRTLCRNYDKEDGLDTVLEVPIPEEMFRNMGANSASRWHQMRGLMRAQAADNNLSMLHSKTNNEFVALLKLVGSPLLPFQVHSDQPFTAHFNDCSIEASKAKYIVQQYVAACGGPAALSQVNSMYAVGEVKMAGSEMHQGDDSVRAGKSTEVGGFVLWQKNPDLWCLELVVSGYKISAGSDGKVGWNESSTQASPANRGGPPRPLRRLFQGLDPRCTAHLFLEAVCTGEQNINGEDCFVLKVETDANILQAQSSSNTEVRHHTIWGYFSHRTGLLVKLEDKKLVKMKPIKGNDAAFWETTIETTVGDYRYIEGLNIAHSGTTTATLHRYGGPINHKRKIEETWTIEEVDFNINGLSMDCFLPPADIKKEHHEEQ
ncbi:hypothetical protein Tsubulata_038810 [Turnera subulata]|uniref:DUF620 domain-containing protein n=1 Tax=Turnera subulata TaxID=218843 RepID=A0A9Q0F5C8_9ROSI|nr:hypothetical protein Tsubulata_038810 [Turnera subulata]